MYSMIMCPAEGVLVIEAVGSNSSVHKNSGGLTDIQLPDPGNKSPIKLPFHFM